MARQRRGPRCQDPRWKHVLSLGLHYLSDADSTDEELDGLHLLELALRLRRLSRKNNRCGPRGSYDGVQVPQFLDALLYKFSPRRFKAWLR